MSRRKKGRTTRTYLEGGKKGLTVGVHLSAAWREGGMGPLTHICPAKERKKGDSPPLISPSEEGRMRLQRCAKEPDSAWTRELEKKLLATVEEFVYSLRFG